MQTIRIAVKTFVPLVVVLLCTPNSVQAQADPTVETPTAARGAIVEIPTSGQGGVIRGLPTDVAMAGQYKSTKEMIEPEKPVCLNWYADIGYESQYNFRGTNLTPDADGALFVTADVSKWGFTLGLYGIHQLGTAHAPSWSIGEGGGGGSFSSGDFSLTGPVFPETVQDRFNEIDVFLQYSRSFGPINVTVGNIAFFIDRRAQTFVNAPDFVFFGPAGRGIYGPYPTVENERFDRVFIRLATTVIPHIEPWITYYQTIYSEGTDQFHHLSFQKGNNTGIGTFIFYNSFERSPEDHGGYLEGRLRGNFAIGKWIDFNPYGVISYSFGDRSEPVTNPANFSEVIRGRPLRDWNVAQAGFEIPIHLVHLTGVSTGPCAPPDFTLALVPFFTYSYHISDPTAGTDRNEVWGGAKFAITF